MRKSKIYVAEMPLVTREYAEAIDKRFPEIKPKPGTDQETLLFNAGQRSVIEFIKNTSTHREVSGDPGKLRNQYSPSLLSKIIDNIKQI